MEEARFYIQNRFRNGKLLRAGMFHDFLIKVCWYVDGMLGCWTDCRQGKPACVTVSSFADDGNHLGQRPLVPELRYFLHHYLNTGSLQWNSQCRSVYSFAHLYGYEPDTVEILSRILIFFSLYLMNVHAITDTPV